MFFLLLLFFCSVVVNKINLPKFPIHFLFFIFFLRITNAVFQQRIFRKKKILKFNVSVSTSNKTSANLYFQTKIEMQWLHAIQQKDDNIYTCRITHYSSHSDFQLTLFKTSPRPLTIFVGTFICHHTLASTSVF